MTLSVKQKKVIQLLFEGIAEDELFIKAAVTRRMFLTWLSQKAFVEALQSRVSAAAVRSQMIIARHCPMAVARLVNLTESTNTETARKACLDILQLTSSATPRPAELGLAGAATNKVAPLSGAQQSRLLAALADNAGDEQTTE